MRRKSRSPLPFSTHPPTPFQSAEEAWFWFIRCQKARNDGARLKSNAALVTRPCDPDDLYRAIRELFTNRLINRQHLRTLATFGNFERPPDPRCREEERPYRLWNEALDRLETILKRKEIMA